MSACIGSGYCCKKAPCGIAAAKYGPEHWDTRTPVLHADGKVEIVGSEGKGCPSLRFDERQDRYLCGEVLDAVGERREWLIKELAIGAGCCSALNSDRLEKIRRMKEKA